MRDYLASSQVPYMEAEIEAYLEQAEIDFVSDIKTLVDNVDVIFLAVQTPHDPKFVCEDRTYFQERPENNCE